MTSPRRRGSCLPVAIAITCGFCPAALAHEIRPALLDITERSPGWFDVTWKVPMRGDMILAIEPVFPASLEPVGPPSSRLIPGARVQVFTLRGTTESLIGQRIAIDGLSALQIDVLLRIELADGSSHSAILRPSSPSFEIPARASKGEVAWSYSRMGLFHILGGIDHLLFLVAMLILVSGFVKLIKTITAFTVAHSVTLALASPGVVHVPSAPTEAVISLSIVFLAVEILHERSGKKGLAGRYPWGVAFVFGLFHGLGFAGALSELGLPQHEVPLALFMFDVGVEAGQILFVVVVVGLIAVLKRIRLPVTEGRLVPYAVGSIAAFWTIERIAIAL